jgi:hypothetical protein
MAHSLRHFWFTSIFFLHQFHKNDRDISGHFAHKSSHDVLEATLSPPYHQIVAPFHDICDFFVRIIGVACKPTYQKMVGTPMKFGPDIPHIPSSLYLPS